MNIKLLVLMPLLYAPLVNGEIIVAQCDSPTGWRVDHGGTSTSDEVSLLNPMTDTDGFRGSNPQFIFDTTKPKTLVEITDPIEIEGVEAEIIERLMPSEVKEYSVVVAQDKFIFAVDVGDNSLWTYALYPDLGFLVIGRNTAWGIPVGTKAVGATYYATCKFIRND